MMNWKVHLWVNLFEQCLATEVVCCSVINPAADLTTSLLARSFPANMLPVSWDNTGSYYIFVDKINLRRKNCIYVI